MNPANFSVSWFDFAAVLVIMVGVLRGRRRGMSEELLDVVKWLAIVGVGAFLYEPVGNVLSQQLPFGRLSCYLAVYISVIILFKVAFAVIKRQIGDKLIGSDVFGKSEYYLGMMAGAVRYACLLVVFLSLFGARQYSEEEIRADDRFQEQNYGSIRFPKHYSLQKQIFGDSLVGRLSYEHTPWLLIRPTSPEEKGLGASGLARARQRDFNDALGKR